MSGGHRVTLRVAWRSEDLVRLEAEAVAAGRVEAATAYTTAAALGRFAGELARFAAGAAASAGYRAGGEEGLGLVALEFGPGDEPGRARCRVRLVTNLRSVYDRVGRVDDAALDLGLARAALGRFAERLGLLAADAAADADLAVD